MDAYQCKYQHSFSRPHNALLNLQAITVFRRVWKESNMQQSRPDKPTQTVTAVTHATPLGAIDMQSFQAAIAMLQRQIDDTAGAPVAALASAAASGHPPAHLQQAQPATLCTRSMARLQCEACNKWFVSDLLLRTHKCDPSTRSRATRKMCAEIVLGLLNEVVRSGNSEHRLQLRQDALRCRPYSTALSMVSFEDDPTDSTEGASEQPGTGDAVHQQTPLAFSEKLRDFSSAPNLLRLSRKGEIY